VNLRSQCNEQKKSPSIGVIFHPSFPPSSLAEYARRAEVAGFDELWLWDDCFLPGAFSASAIALAATSRLKVGIGLLPVPAHNPLFAAMEITTLAGAYPGRFLPGFGHGVRSWMEQIGSAPPSQLKALEETLAAVRGLLAGELVSQRGTWVNLEQVRMEMIPSSAPPIYVGGIRAKTLHLSGRLADGTILTSQSSPQYIRWAVEQIHAGMAEGGRRNHRVAIYLDVKVDPDRQSARAAARRALAERLPWDDVKLDAPGIREEVADFLRTNKTMEEIVRNIPDAWVDAFTAAGAPDEVAEGIISRFDAGADTVIFQPLNGDPDCLEEYIRYLKPLRDLAG
jgi:alkanesulfonate monooxygenase SsuD/methylene tetrahydromethanopterin reductase-like flavin-dependent oxidoreductase (luciferase family)